MFYPAKKNPVELFNCRDLIVALLYPLLLFCSRPIHFQAMFVIPSV